MNAFLTISGIAVSILAALVIYIIRSNRKFIKKVNEKDD
jgi:hypothetical protein